MRKTDLFSLYKDCTNEQKANLIHKFKETYFVYIKVIFGLRNLFIGYININ